MKKLLYTENIGFDMSDWEREPIEKVFAGTDCIMAVTSDGRTLQKTTKPEYAARTKYWTRVEQIAVSGWASCHAIGLISDGTCMIAKRFVRSWCEDAEDALPFDAVNNEVKSWTDITQVAVSDSFFGLDRKGKVHVSPLSRHERRDYADVGTWNGVVRIVAGSQSGVLGITGEGNVLCAGASFVRGPHGDVRDRLAALKNVADICTTGSECEEIVVAYNDGTVETLGGREIFDHAWTGPLEKGTSVLQSHFRYEVIILDSDRKLVRWAPQAGGLSSVFSICPLISSYAIGDRNFGKPFVIAVSERLRAPGI